MSITRIEILHRAATQWPVNSVRYNQGRSHPDASGKLWRTDCSGFVSMCLNLTEGMGGGRTTVGLVTNGFVHRIQKGELRPGDMVGHLGGGTDFDDGHVVLFDHWTRPDHSAYMAYELHGGPPPPAPPTLGPVHRAMQYPYEPYHAHYRPYRYKGIKVHQADWKWTSTGGLSLAKLAAATGAGVSTVLRLTAHHEHQFDPHLAWYINQRNWQKKLPKGAVVWTFPHQEQDSGDPVKWESTGQYTMAKIANSHGMKVSKVLSLTAQKQEKYDAVMAEFIGNINWGAKPLPTHSVIWFPAGT
jgi:hypothetical protein